VHRWVDARYRGQSFELRVPARAWTEAFHRTHEERYGYARRDAPVEAVTVRVVAEAPGPEMAALQIPEASAPPPAEPTEVHAAGEAVAALRVRRKDLRAGHDLAGPLIVQEYSATTWVPVGWRLQVDAWGTLHLLRSGGG
jgi:N-methylhydantoinase A